MKVIFVASGNKKGAGQVSSFVQSQYESLKAAGLDMLLMPVRGHGTMAHLKAAWQLRKLVRREKPDVIHAHYSIYGYVAAIACFGLCKKPKIVVSILGSFPRRNKKWKLVRFCVQHVWDKTLVKSERTKRQLGLDVPVIPNGVNLEVFQVKSKEESRKEIGWNVDAARLDSSNLDAAHLGETKYIIWCSNPERPEKDYRLAEDAVHLLESKILDPNGFSVKLVPVFNKTPEEVCTYMNAADCLLLTSVSEGSPNVIKEAMACNCPIVTTEVGDVRERLHNLEGCYVVEEPEALDATHLDAMRLENERVRDAVHLDAARLEKTRRVAAALEKALVFGKRTDGRNCILNDKLEISQIAKRIIEVYEQV